MAIVAVDERIPETAGGHRHPRQSHSLNWRTLQPYFVWRRDRTVVLTAFAAVMVFGVLNGLLLAMVVSIAMLLKRMAQARVAELGRLPQSHDFVNRQLHPEAQAISGLLIVRPEERLFWQCRRGDGRYCCKSAQRRESESGGAELLEESPD